MAGQLTSGAIHTLMVGGQVNKPVFQLLGFKKIPGNHPTDRYRLMVSDGQHCHGFGMLATQLNGLLTSGEMEINCVIRLDKHVCNQVQENKRVLIILEVTVLRSATVVGGKIGNPVQYVVGECTATPSATPAVISKPETLASNTGVFGRQNGTVKPDDFGASGARNLCPIAALTPYQNRWTIRARVTNKSAIRTWNNSRGEGKLFSMDLLDDSGEIRITAFNEQCDKYHDMIELNKVYYFTSAQIKTANKKFTSIKNDYEATFKADTVVELCTDASDGDLPTIQFSFTPINELPQLQKDTIVDVIGICKSSGDVQSIVARTTNRELKKRDLQLVDQTGMEVNLTLWGGEAEGFDASSNPVVAIKGARLSDFSGVSLSALSSSTLFTNPDIKESFVLKGWFDREGSSNNIQSISKGGGIGGSGSNWKCLRQFHSENLGMGEKPDYVTCKAHAIMIRKENCMYMACPTADCNKKVVDQCNGMYRCEKCNQEFSEYKYRLLLNVHIADFSDHQWVTCFQESAEAILGISANDLGNLRDTNESEFQAVFTRANFTTFTFKLRTKMETYNDENRLKTSVVAVTPIDYRDYSRKLIADLKTLSQ